MIDDCVVVDGVVHGYYSPPGSYSHPVAGMVLDSLYHGYHQNYSPRGEPKWQLDKDRFVRADTALLGDAVFAQSPTDFAVYHDIPLYGLYRDGASPLWIGQQLRERHPGRVALFGGVWPFHPDPIGEVDRLVDEVGVSGLKFYPYDIYDGVGQTTRMDDREAVFPILEHARKRGIRSVAVHKAIAMTGCPVQPFRSGDLDDALLAFPDITFQIVHGGFAFVEETAVQLSYYRNAAVVLEGASAYLANAPLKFAQILASFVMAGASDRIIWGTGCTALHPRPLVEAFWRFEWPEALAEGYGLRPMTREFKRAVLGGNLARILGVDLDSIPPNTAAMAEPWS